MAKQGGRARRVRKRAVKGGGTVFEKSPGLWVARKPIGTKLNAGGKRVTRYVERTGRTSAEAIRRRDAALPPSPSITLANWSTRWLASLDHKPQTVDSYRDAMRLHILPRLGTRPLASITAFDVEEAMRLWGRAAAAGTVAKILSCLSGCLQAAVRAKITTENVARQVERPKAPKVKFDLFTREELARIIEAGLSRRTWRCFALCAATGCRIGEATALSPGDYDAATGMLTISKTLTRRNGITSAKSEASHRTIEVPAQARPALVAGIRNSPYANVHVFWRNLLHSLGLRYRGIHQLKHSVASIFVAKGTDLADASAYLGDTFEVFMTTYAHPTGANMARVLEAALGGGKVSGGEAGDANVPKKSARKRQAS